MQTWLELKLRIKSNLQTKGVNSCSKDVTTKTWLTNSNSHLACKYIQGHKLHQRYIWGCTFGGHFCVYSQARWEWLDAAVVFFCCVQMCDIFWALIIRPQFIRIKWHHNMHDIIYPQATYTKLKQSINKPGVSYKATTRQNRWLVFYAHKKNTNQNTQSIKNKYLS